MSQQKSNHYVNNENFLKALKEHRQKVQEAAQAGLPKPIVPNYIGECILKIANHLSYKPNFINYTFKDEMIGDGIENSVMYLDNFDPEKSSNPFAYFTQIIYYAFVRRIQKEKRQTLIKGKIIMDMPFDVFDVQDHDEDGTYTSSYLDFVRSNGVYDEVVMKDQQRKIKPDRASPLDDILEGD